MGINIAFTKLQSQGKRITKVRRYIITIFHSAQGPLTAGEIIRSLRDDLLFPNKTTVYREIENLCELNILQPVYLKPHIVHYEWADREHHHHLICIKCNTIQELTDDEVERSLLELRKKTQFNGFIINEHRLELYGHCTTCV